MNITHNNFLIEEIFQIKKMKSQKKFQSERPIIIITSDLFIILANTDRNNTLQEIIQSKKYLDTIRFIDILDMRFPNLDRAHEKLRDKSKGVPFKIITPHEDYLIYVSENDFLRTRDFLRNITQKKEEVK